MKRGLFSVISLLLLLQHSENEVGTREERSLRVPTIWAGWEIMERSVRAFKNLTDPMRYCLYNLQVLKLEGRLDLLMMNQVDSPIGDWGAWPWESAIVNL